MSETIQGIYKIENTKTGKVYIGQSTDIYRRWDEHKSNLANNKHHSYKLQNSYNRTKDKSVFEYSILEVVDNNTKLNAREKYYIDFYNSFHDGYNCSDVNKFMNTKMLNKAKQRYYNNLIFNLYDPDVIKISKSWFYRLEDKYYYSGTNQQRIYTMMKWFYDNYYEKDNTLTLKIQGVSNTALGAYIINKDEKVIESYKFGILKDKNKDSKHRVVYSYKEKKKYTYKDNNIWIWADEKE